MKDTSSRRPRRIKPSATSRQASFRDTSIDVEFKAAQAAQLRFEQCGGSPNDRTGPLYQWNTRRQFEDLRVLYESGDCGVLFAAIRECASNELVMPDWVARGFISGYDKLVSCQVKSWDEAFGRPFPRGTNLNALRKRREKSIQVLLEVRRRHDRGASIGKELFDEIGRSLNISGSTARDYYYQWTAFRFASGPTAFPKLKRTRVTQSRRKRL